MALKISVVQTEDLDAAHQTKWREFQRSHSDLGNPFLSPELAVIFGRHRNNIRVAVMEDGNDVVGFFPYEQHPLGVARGLGYGLTDAQGVVHRPDIEWTGEELLRACRLDVYEFDHLVGYQGQQIRQNVTLAPSPVVDVSTCWDTWIESKKKANSRRINTAMQKQRKMAREVGELRLDADCRDPAMLAKLMEWKSAQYRRTSRPDRFAKPWFRELVQDCFAQHTDAFSSRLSVLYAGDTPVNIDLSLHANGILGGWFPAFDVEYARYSPGFVAMLEMIKAATSDPSIEHLDMGKGEAPYKESLKSFDSTVAEGWVNRSTLGSLAWRARTEPKRRVMSFVLGNPKLRVAARQTLNKIGKLRS